MNVLEVKNLKTHFFTDRGVVKAVNGVSFKLRKQETIGLVGESGCGKSITSLSLLRLVPKPAGKIVDGEIILDGENILQKSEKQMRQLRGKKISMILQEPMTSLNPVFTVGEQIKEALRIHQKIEPKLVEKKAEKLLEKVKISSPKIRMKQFPHQMSGGMRQRVVGAISIACEPVVLIADEPTTALDVTVQAQYLRLLKELQEDIKTSIIFITHDLGIINQICDRVCVMYAGKILESAPVKELFDNPVHPYTKALIKSVPAINRKIERLYSIDGQPPSMLDLAEGCAFKPRCQEFDKKKCQDDFPGEFKVGHDHMVSCWRASS